MCCRAWQCVENAFLLHLRMKCTKQLLMHNCLKKVIRLQSGHLEEKVCVAAVALILLFGVWVCRILVMILIGIRDVKLFPVNQFPFLKNLAKQFVHCCYAFVAVWYALPAALSLLGYLLKQCILLYFIGHLGLCYHLWYLSLVNVSY